MIIAVLGFLDIIVGISLLFPNFLSLYLGIIILIKGIFSIIGSLESKFFLLLSLIDVTAGIILLFNFSIPWFWLLPMIKGVYSLIVGMANR